MLHETGPIDRYTSNFTYSICTMELHLSVPFMYIYIGGGGGQKTKWKTPSPNFEDLIESITNMLFFFSGGLGKTL